MKAVRQRRRHSDRNRHRRHRQRKRIWRTAQPTAPSTWLVAATSTTTRTASSSETTKVPWLPMAAASGTIPSTEYRTFPAASVDCTENWWGDVEGPIEGPSSAPRDGVTMLCRLRPVARRSLSQRRTRRHQRQVQGQPPLGRARSQGHLHRPLYSRSGMLRSTNGSGTSAMAPPPRSRIPPTSTIVRVPMPSCSPCGIPATSPGPSR